MTMAKKGKAGRPTTYDKDIADMVIERVANGETLRAICRDIGHPESTFRLWVVEDRGGIAARYARAREAQAEAWSDEIIELADEASNDTKEGRDGAEMADHEWISRSKLRVDTRKWLMAKLHPKAYGERLEHVGPAGGPLEIRWLAAALPEQKP